MSELTENRFDYLELEDALPAPEIPVSEAPPAPGVRRSWKLTGLLGTAGRHSGGLAAPAGLALDQRGQLFVADCYNHRVQRLSRRGDFAPLGDRGSKQGEFLTPRDLVLDSAGRLYVLEQGNCRIQVFSNAGLFLGAFGREGAGAAEFRSPCGICLLRDGNLLVADTGNRRLALWTRYGKPLQIIAFGQGKQPLFELPQAVAELPDGTIAVADRSRHLLLMFDPAWQLVGMLGGCGSARGEMREPNGLAVDAGGRLFVTEAGNDRVTVVSAGRAVEEIIGAETCDFNMPHGIVVSRSGVIFVADTGAHRIVRLDPRSP